MDIKVSEFLDRLVFAPRVVGDSSHLLSLLKKHNPLIRFTRSAEGVWLHACDVDKLELNEVGIEFQWTDSSRRFLENRLRARKNMPNQLEGIRRIRAGGKATARTYLNGVRGLDVLDDHQWVNVACMTLPNSCGLCVFDEQGAGKTVTLIFAFDVLVEKNEADFALIIAPKSMVSEWPVDFAKFMTDRYHVQTITGSSSDKRIQLSRKSDVIVTNFETAVLMEDELRSLVRRHGSRAVLVVDESFFTKNELARRTQAIRRLREYCGRTFVLCGTPAPNSGVDLVQQFNIVDYGVTFDGVKLPKERDQAAGIIQNIIEERGPYVRHLKAEVLPELPNKKFNRVSVPLQPEQSRLYSGILNGLVNDLTAVDDEHFERNKLSFLARRTALLQICSNPVSVTDGYVEIPGKLLALDRILKELIEEKKEKVIVWSFYTASLDRIVSRYAKYNPSRYDGTVTDITQRREAVRRFRNDPDVLLFVGNPAAAGAGLNLQSARFAVYESLSNQAAHYLQSLDRIHRRGQNKEAEYIILLCDQTIEIREYDRLIEKERLAQGILGDKIELPVTRQTMLDDLVLSMK